MLACLGLGLALLSAPAVPEEAAERRVVPFALPDLEGRTWTPADLRGRVALINVWAVWCKPCRAELPFLQKLHERLATRTDVVVLSISIDEKPAEARALASKLGLTFPVLLGPEFVETHFLATGLGIPVSWLVDPDGVLRRAPPRFDEDDGEAWLQAMLKTLAAPPAPSE